MGGICIVPYHTLITQRKLTLLVQKIRTQKQLGQCIIINLKWTKLQAGRRNVILTSEDTIEYIENIWVIQLHNQLQDMKGKPLLHQMEDSILQREIDVLLMDGFRQ